MTKSTDKRRRRIMLAVGVSAAAAGAALMLRQGGGTAYPRGEPLTVALGDLVQGKLRTVIWQGLPVWLLRRSDAQLAALAAQDAALADPDSLHSVQPAYCNNRHRSLRADLLVAVGLCTHQGCTPALVADGAFLCPCHASRYDLAGRVFKVGPAPDNLVIPAYHFASETSLVLGADA